MGRVCRFCRNSSDPSDHTRRCARRKAARQHGVVTLAQLLAARLRSARDRVSPPRRASAPPSPRGLRRGSPPTVTARHGDGGGARLRSGRGAESPLGGGAVADRPALASPTEVTTPTERRHPGIHIHRSPPRRHHHPLRHPRHDPGPHARRPRRRPEPQAAHPSRQRGPGPTARHRPRADHPPHPLSRPAHLTAHARAGRHPLPARGPLRPLPQAPPPPAPRAQPTRSAGHEVDAVYREQKLVIELDSRQFHTTPQRLRARPRPRRRPPQRGVLHAPHHRPPPQTSPRQRGQRLDGILRAQARD